MYSFGRISQADRKTDRQDNTGFFYYYIDLVSSA